jgi:serine O-acetyltransferase
LGSSLQFILIMDMAAQQTTPIVEPEWSREIPEPGEWKPAFRLIHALRDYQRYQETSGPCACLMRITATLRHRFWSAVSGADIPLNARHVGGGLMLPHPNGIVIHPDAVIGPNVLLFQQVTIGSGGSKPGVPVLGSGVCVGAGAKILGGIRVGTNARIGANAVVISDVPDGATAVGVPARVILPE